MKKTIFLFLISIQLLHLSLFVPPKPNILWLSVEDMSPRLGCYGDLTVPTPHIDRLAKNGVKFNKMYTTAGVCAPSRNAIATGRIQTSNGGHNMRTLMDTYPSQTGLPKSYSVVLPNGVRHFAELLREQGYYCTNNAKTDYQFEDTPAIWDESSAHAHYKNRKEGQPFFAIFNHMGTHESQIWAKANKPLRVQPNALKLPPFYPDTDSVRLDLARHYTNISEMDDWVGAQLAELEKLGELDNTILMFWSDHGDGLPYIKREVYERGLHVPFIVSAPKGITVQGLKQAGQEDNRLLSSIDWAATVLNLIGIKTPIWMQGKPFLGPNFNKKGNPYVYAARDRMDSEYDRVRSVYDGRIQYVYNFNENLPRYQNVAFRMQQAGMREILRKRDLGQLNATQMQWFELTKPNEELYDLQKDPHQLVNLINNTSYLNTLQNLRLAFKNWQKTIVDFGNIPEKELVKNMWNGQDGPPITITPELQTINKQIRLSCKTKSATIVYKLWPKTEAEPSHWHIYTKGIIKAQGQNLKYMAQRIGYLPSQVVFVE